MEPSWTLIPILCNSFYDDFSFYFAVTLAEHAADDLRLQVEENEKLEPLKGVELDLTFGQALSDEEMPKAPEPEPVIKTVEGSVTLPSKGSVFADGFIVILMGA